VIRTDVQVDANDVARAFRILKQLDPDLVKEFRTGLQSDLKPAAKAIAQKYPTAPYLSKLEGGTRFVFNKKTGEIDAKENWKWSEVVGKVSITPGKARKGVGRNNLVAIRMQYKGAIPWVTEFGKADSGNLSGQGKALIRNIESKYPSWPNGGRIFYKEFQSRRGDIFNSAENIMSKFIDGINRVI